MTDRLESMLAAQLGIQRLVAEDPLLLTGEERVQYVKDMILACTDELHEALNETGWKPWATSRHVNSRAAFGELRDAWQFLTNAMFAVAQVPPSALAIMLHAELFDKLKTNAERHSAGYDGVTGKCPQCHRDISEMDVKEVRAQSTQRIDIHCVCGAYLGSRAI